MTGINTAQILSLKSLKETYKMQRTYEQRFTNRLSIFDHSKFLKRTIYSRQAEKGEATNKT